ncbi:uncharacterized protein LOC100185697 [Ciona intestinalis]
MLTGIVLPPNTLSQEERRNVILRLRYGHGPAPALIKDQSAKKLFVVGQSVVSKLRHPVISQVHDILKTRVRRVTEENIRRSCGIASRSKSEDNMSSRLSLNSVPGTKTLKAPPSTPREMQPVPGSYNESLFHESGDISGASKKTEPTSSSSRGDFNPTPCAHGHRRKSDSPPDRIKVRKSNSNLRKKNTSKVFPVPLENGPAVMVTKPARRVVGGAVESEVIKRRPSTNSQDGKQEKRPHIRRSGPPRKGKPRDSMTSSVPMSASQTKATSLKKSLTSRNQINNDSAKRIQGKPEAKKPQESTKPSKEDLKDLEKSTIRHFKEMPKSRPKRVCFDYPGIDITHVDVKRAIEKVIPDSFESNKVTFVQFENINVKLGTRGLNNRWHIELADFTTRNKLIKSGLELRCARRPNDDLSTLTQLPSNRSRGHMQSSVKKLVEVKLYDNVTMEEYKQFLRRTAAEEKLQSVILLCAGRGQTLLSNML